MAGAKGRRRKPVPKHTEPPPRGMLDARSVYDPKYVEQAKKLVAKGWPDHQIADFFDINRTQLWRWKGWYPDFAAAFVRGEAVMISAMEHSMFEAATGYRHAEAKIFPPRTTVRKVKGKAVEVVHEPVVVMTERHYPPDAQAARILLKKLDPKKYNDKLIHVGDTHDPVVFQLVNRPPKEKRDGKPKTASVLNRPPKP